MTVKRIVVVAALIFVVAACSGEGPSLTAELDPGATAVPDPIAPRVCNGVVSLAEQLVVLDATDTRRVDAIVQRATATVSTVPVDAPAEVITLLTQIGASLNSPDAEIAQVAAAEAIAAETGAAGTYLTATCTAYLAGSLTGGLEASATTSAGIRGAEITYAAGTKPREAVDAAEVDNSEPDQTRPDDADDAEAVGDGADSAQVDDRSPVPEGVFEIQFAPLMDTYEGVEFGVTRITRTVAEPAAVLAGAALDDTSTGNWILVGMSFTGGPEVSRSFDAANVLLIDSGRTVLRAEALLANDGSAAGGFAVAPGQVVDRVAVFAVAADVTELAGWSVGVGRSGQVPATRSLEVSRSFRYPLVLDSGEAGTRTIPHAVSECRNGPDAPLLTVSIVQVIASPEPWFLSGSRSALGTRHVSVVATIASSIVPATEGPCAEIDVEISNYPLTLLVDGAPVASERSGFGLAELPTEPTLVSAAFRVPFSASRLSLVDVEGLVIGDWVMSLPPEIGE